MGEVWKCTESICYLIGEARAEEPVPFKEEVSANPILSEVLRGKKTLRSSYASVYGDTTENRKALLILKSQFKGLGYEVGRINDPSIPAGVVYDFQRLCGIYDGASGTLIGQKTLEALIIASKAGRDWKKKVAGIYDRQPIGNTFEIKRIREELSTVKIAQGGLYLGERESKLFELVREAYVVLGFNVEGENIIFANYKLQIISGVNDKRNIANFYGPATHKALLKALEAAEEGKDWRTLKSFKKEVEK